jgi:O-antigen ligase
MIADSPITGVGLDNFLYSYRGKYISPDAWQDPNISHAHNVILDFSARLGLPGLASIMWMLYTFFKTANRTIRTAMDPKLKLLTIGLTASMINFIAHGLVDASYWFIDLAFAFMLTISIIQRITNIDDHPESTELEN